MCTVDKNEDVSQTAQESSGKERTVDMIEDGCRSKVE